MKTTIINPFSFEIGSQPIETVEINNADNLAEFYVALSEPSLGVRVSVIEMAYINSDQDFIYVNEEGHACQNTMKNFVLLKGASAPFFGKLAICGDDMEGGTQSAKVADADWAKANVTFLRVHNDVWTTFHWDGEKWLRRPAAQYGLPNVGDLIAHILENGPVFLD